MTGPKTYETFRIALAATWCAVLAVAATARAAPDEDEAAWTQLDPAVFVAWGDEHGYASTTTRDGRVVLVARDDRLKRLMKVVDAVLEELDDGPLGGGPVAPQAEGGTIVLLGLRDPEEFESVDDLVLHAGRDGEDGADGEDGEDGAPGEDGGDGAAGDDAGDVHAQPFFRALDLDTHLTTLGMQLDAVQLAAFWDEPFEWQGRAKDPEMKPTNHPESELANRLAHLWLYRYHGPQPAWFRRGFAWSVEYETTKVDGDKRIGRFPQMLFTMVREPEQPRTWNSQLEGPLSTLDVDVFEGLVTWSAAYHEPAAARAWGLVQYLLSDKKHRKALPDALRDLAAAGTAHFEATEDGYEADALDQLRILREHFGDDVLERASKAFRSAEKKFR